MMRSVVRASLAAVATSFLAVVGAFAQNNPPDTSGWTQRWAADHQALLNAKLAGLKAGLQLTARLEITLPNLRALRGVG